MYKVILILDKFYLKYEGPPPTGKTTLKKSSLVGVKITGGSKAMLHNRPNKIKISPVKKKHNYPANIYLFKVNNRNIRKRCELRSKLTIKTPG